MKGGRSGNIPLTFIIDTTQEENGVAFINQFLQNEQIAQLLAADKLRPFFFVSVNTGFDPLTQGAVVSFVATNLPSQFQKTAPLYLDQYRTIEGRPQDKPAHKLYRDWYLNQALLFEQIAKTADPEDRNILQMLMLQAFSKAAPSDPSENVVIGKQMTPLTFSNNDYYRLAKSPLYVEVRTAFAQKLGLELSEVQLADSLLALTIFKREFVPIIGYTIKNTKQLEKAFQKLYAQVPADVTDIWMDFSPFMQEISQLNSHRPKEWVFGQLKLKIGSMLNNARQNYLNNHPGQTDPYEGHLFLFALTSYQNENLLLIPNLNQTPRGIQRHQDFQTLGKLFFSDMVST